MERFKMLLAMVLALYDTSMEIALYGLVQHFPQ